MVEERLHHDDHYDADLPNNWRGMVESLGPLVNNKSLAALYTGAFYLPFSLPLPVNRTTNVFRLHGSVIIALVTDS